MLRLRRRRLARPRIENLESRVTPSNIGVNLNANAPYLGDYIWVDVHNLFSTWSPVSGTATVPVNSDNYPLAPATAYADLADYPDGNYQLSYQGTATVSFTGIGYLAAPVVTDSNGVSTGTVVIDHELGNGTNLRLTVNGVSSTATFSDFHLYSPGYGSNPTQMFTNAFLDTLKPFSTLRFVQWNATINSTVSTWQQRTSPSSFIATGSSGVPYEDMIALSNETQKDMWITLPALATPNYVENLAQLIYADLDPNLKVYVEYSDETWNAGWLEHSQVLKAAQSNPLVNAQGAVGQVAQQSAFELVTAAQIFDQVFGASSARVRPIVAGFSEDTAVAQHQLEFIQANYGTPSQYVWGVAIAPYLSLPAGDNTAGLTENQLFNDLTVDFNTDFTHALQTNNAVAKSYNLPLVTYEGGTSIPSVNGIARQVKEQAQFDPRMYQLYVTMMNYWNQTIGSGNLFMDYDLDGTYTDIRFFGLLQSVSDAGSQKYDALLSEIFPAGDANLDGTVDESDFQIVAANYGRSNAWWEQGDFNDDGLVNWSDLNSLRTDLDPSATTLAQYAQIAVFGQPSVVTVGQVPVYDGYGVTYVSNMPWVSSSNGSGPVRRNLTSGGAAITVGSLDFPYGLGVYANSSVTVELGGQYSRFQTDLGVNGTNNSSAVIFEVFGDGKLLYQSQVVTDNSGAIPIDLNVAGVQQLTLDVMGATANTSGDHAVWADARLISTANFSEDQESPYSLSWQVSRNGQVLSTQTTDSFLLAYTQPGVYTVSLTVTDSGGNTASASTTVTISPPASSATLLTKDTTTQGNWIEFYGGQGEDLAGSTSTIPSYASVAVGNGAVTSAGSTTDPRGLQLASGTGRIDAAWSSTTKFSITVDLDTLGHDVSLYAVDWDGAGRSEQIQITSATTGAVLDTETLSNFSAGVYLDWRLSGDVIITVTRLAGPSAVVSGLFFDAPPNTAIPVAEDSATRGNWIGTYGTDGYNVIGLPASYPSYATVSVTGALEAVWDYGASDPQGLLEPGGTNRLAGALFANSSFAVHVTLNDGQSHDIAVYALDWNDVGRHELVRVTSAATGAILSEQLLTNFNAGVYLQWVVTGSVVITVTQEGGGSGQAVLSGLFFDPPSAPRIAAPVATATLVTKDAASQGNWIGTYGTDGYDIAGMMANLPGYAVIALSGDSLETPSNGVIGDLQNPGGVGRNANYWANGNILSVDVSITDGQAHDVTIYVLNGYGEQIQVTDAATGAVLDTESASITTGLFLEWTVTGSVVITMTRVTSGAAVLSGVFLDPPTPNATLVNRDNTTQGSWIGTYGAQGNNVIGLTPSYPSYATVQPAGQTNLTWTSNTNDPRALEEAGNQARIAEAWASATSFTLSVSFSDDQAHNLALYAVDFDNQGRSERVKITRAATGALLDSETLTGFSGGVYLDWRIFGSVVITVTRVAGPSAVVSGLFFDAATVSATASASTTAEVTKQDSRTEGTWKGGYGSRGYDIAGGTSSVPSSTFLKVFGTSETWAASTTDPRAMQKGSSTGRVAAAWDSSTALVIGVNLADGNPHELSIYAIDWNKLGRIEEVDVSSAITGALLDSQILTKFTNGVYLQWEVSGSVIITVRPLAGPNAVVSGIFFDSVNSASSTASATASLVKVDKTTEGNWIARYGTSGETVVGDSTQFPSAITFEPTGYNTLSWATSTTETRALRTATGTSRVAAAWSSNTSFTVDVNVQSATRRTSPSTRSTGATRAAASKSSSRAQRPGRFSIPR